MLAVSRRLAPVLSALALGLGMILIALSIGVSTVAFLLAGETERK